MAPNTIPRKPLNDPTKHNEIDTAEHVTGIPSPWLFGAAAALLIVLFQWPRRWLLSGAPVLMFVILLGASKGNKVLPFLGIWPMFAMLNLSYAVCTTSWLLYGFFVTSCWPAIFLTCVFQFSYVSNAVRKSLRRVLKQLQFIDDKIAFFDIPALEIDTEVDGLMVVRGITFSISTLTAVVHGIEVGIKLSDDMELALQTEEVTVSLFRGIEIGDVFANLKGGQYEMTFGSLEESTNDDNGEALMMSDTPLLRAATANGDMSRPPLVGMKSEFTGGMKPKDTSAQAGYDSMSTMSPDDKKASKHYGKMLQWIQETNSVGECRKTIRHRLGQMHADDRSFEKSDVNEMRAAICSQLHGQPSVPHPPRTSVKVTTLQNLSSPNTRQFLHRLPMLLRLLLNPLSYFHPVHIKSITATASGKWVRYMLGEHIFQYYGDQDGEIRRLEAKIDAWLSDANFAFELAEMTGTALVPVISAYDIITHLAFTDVMAYRTLPQHTDLKQVIRLGGADATFTIPSFLLPHHEHLLPLRPTVQDHQRLSNEVEAADGIPKTIQKQHDLERTMKDESNLKMSVHARLPACFDQELLDFVAALVKATKVVEMEKEPSAMDEEIKGIKDFTKALNKGMKDHMKKAVVGGIVSDRWIAKLVGKITKKLETAQGEAGYSGDIPIQLEPYRAQGKGEGPKLLA